MRPRSAGWESRALHHRGTESTEKKDSAEGGVLDSQYGGDDLYTRMSEAEWQLRRGVHDEWNPRNVRVTELPSGETRASLVFVDDGPMRNRTQRHAAILVSLVLPPQTDWRALQLNLWRYLENVKEHSHA